MYFMTLSSPGAMKQYLGHGKSSYPDLQVEFQPLPITCTTLLTATTLTILHQPVSKRVYAIIRLQTIQYVSNMHVLVTTIKD